MASTGNRADRLASSCAVYYCVCGLVALALDLVSARGNGVFAVGAPISVALMRWLLPIGFIISLAAYLGYPSHMKWRIAAVVEMAMGGLGAAFLWWIAFLGPQ